ncbi:MAG: hypothetical protein ACYDAH_13065 [Steroidobacteraceae bacterium]
MAPHTAKIHTPITHGIRNRAKPLVFQIRKRRLCGFDSYRPLHFQATPGHAGLQDWGQNIDPMGKSWDRAAFIFELADTRQPVSHAFVRAEFTSRLTINQAYARQRLSPL